MMIPTPQAGYGDKSVKLSEAETHAALLQKIGADKDKVAFEKLFTHFAPRIKGLMLKLDRDQELAEDLTQETMLAIWKKAHLFANWRGSASAWIFTIARNNRIDRFRKQGTRHYVDVSELEIPDDGATDSEKKMMNEQRDQQVAAVTEKLPPEQLEVITLSFVENLAQVEIAEKLSIPLGTVKSRMRLAYQKMKLNLEDVL